MGFADATTRAVNAFQVQTDGSLTRVGSDALPQPYPAVAGLAARRRDECTPTNAVAMTRTQLHTHE